MLDTLRDFFKMLAEPSETGVDGNDPRVAAAALMVHVSEADGATSPGEMEALRALLISEYGLDPEEAARVGAAGRMADADAVDLYRFTNVLMQHLSDAQRVRFVELLWEMVFVDGTVHELENNVVWRVSELLGVSSRDRMLMKREAATRRGGESA